jgi:hypothetical protein
MRAAAHENSNTYGQSYQSSESRVDGQNTFLGNERREDVSDAFLELSIPYTPNLTKMTNWFGGQNQYPPENLLANALVPENV